MGSSIFNANVVRAEIKSRELGSKTNPTERNPFRSALARSSLRTGLRIRPLKERYPTVAGAALSAGVEEGVMLGSDVVGSGGAAEGVVALLAGGSDDGEIVGSVTSFTSTSIDMVSRAGE